MAPKVSAPQGTPLTPLAAPAASVALTIRPGRIADGGWAITASTRLPAGSSVFFQLGDKPEHRLDITTGYTNAKLDALLAVIALADAWGTSVKCKLVAIGADGVELASSAAQDFACPVKPYDGALTFDAIAAAVPPFTYPGNGDGRLFKPRADGKYYFEHGGVFETDDKMRGFDCTTFPMALWQKFPSMAGKYGTALAVALEATPCFMEQKKVAEVRAFFADPIRGATGLYFMWSAGHVLLVKDAMIHEFTYGGYKCTPAATRGLSHAPQGLWWIRKLPAKYTA